MNHLKIVLFGLLLCCVTSIVKAERKQLESVNILFIGNSISYYNSLSEQVKAMVEDRLPHLDVNTKLISNGGWTLKQHWNSGRAIREIEQGNWDYVVIQEQTMLGSMLILDGSRYIRSYQPFFDYATKFIQLSKKHGAEPVLFLSWSDSDNQSQQKHVSYASMTLAKQHKIKVAPVGLVWTELVKRNKIELYVDTIHPNPSGSYLAAATIFSTIFEQSPIGLTAAIRGYVLNDDGSPNKGKAQLVRLAEDEAQLIQQAVQKELNNLEKQGGYLALEKPLPDYVIPQLPDGAAVTVANITGRWQGSTSYPFGFDRVVLDVQDNQSELQASLSLYRGQEKTAFEVKRIAIDDGTLNIQFTDNNKFSAELALAINGNQLAGISLAKPVEMVEDYRRWNFTKL